MRERVLGMVLVGIGLVLGYVGAIMPLEAAAAHAQSVSLYMKVIVLVPLCLVFGVMYLVFGQIKMREMIGEVGSRTPLFWVLAVVTVGAGFGLYFLVRTGLENAGYKF